jgi:hypothetical protein
MDPVKYPNLSWESGSGSTQAKKVFKRKEKGRNFVFKEIVEGKRLLLFRCAIMALFMKNFCSTVIFVIKALVRKRIRIMPGSGLCLDPESLSLDTQHLRKLFRFEFDLFYKKNLNLASGVDLGLAVSTVQKERGGRIMNKL